MVLVLHGYLYILVGLLVRVFASGLLMSVLKTIYKEVSVHDSYTGGGGFVSWVVSLLSLSCGRDITRHGTRQASKQEDTSNNQASRPYIQGVSDGVHPSQKSRSAVAQDSKPSHMVVPQPYWTLTTEWCLTQSTNHTLVKG